ncbi:MAG: phage terminase large subunit, partial [Muribaculum sp.]|nr:phage terminase large subunit [Muribaculum sp.]
MARLEKPRGLTINFAPSARQLEVWNALKPNFCDKCYGELILKEDGYDASGHEIYKPTCKKCGNTDISEQILGGGSAGGGKSYLGCCWLVLSCIRFENIRMVVARRVRKVLLESTWVTLKNVLRQWGLKQDIHYHINNQLYTITFWNGSEIMAMELAPSPQDPDYNSLGSLEITGCFIDEVSEVPEKAVEVLSSRIRYNVADTFVVGKTFMS